MPGAPNKKLNAIFYRKNLKKHNFVTFLYIIHKQSK